MEIVFRGQRSSYPVFCCCDSRVSDNDATAQSVGESEITDNPASAEHSALQGFQNDTVGERSADDRRSLRDEEALWHVVTESSVLPVIPSFANADRDQIPKGSMLQEQRT